VLKLITVSSKNSPFKLKKNTSYLVFGFSDDISKIVVLNEGGNRASQNASSEEKNQKWAEMLDTLPENDVRYVVTDIFYDTNDGSREEIILIAWAPDTATIKRKMLCASSKDALKHVLQGVRGNIQASCKADLDLNAIISEKVKSK